MAEIVRMPALSDTMEEGTLVAWHKKVGEAVEAGELLAEIETDKAVMEFQSFFDGVLLHIGVEEGSAVPVDSLIAIIGAEGEDYKAALAAENNAPAKTEEPSSDVIETVSAPLAQNNSSASSEGRIKASPLAKAMAKEEGIDLSKVSGSGDDGRIVKKDIENYLSQQSTTSPATRHEVAAPKVSEAQGDYEDVSLSQMRKTIARRLGDSKFSAPHFYLTMEICVDKLMATRGQIKTLTETKISYNDFIVKAVAKALQEHPSINSSWLGDRIRYYKYVNIGVAVAMDEGLVVPVVRNAHHKSLSSIATEIRELAGRARDRKLTPDEMTGNTFTISNLGMFGIDEFTAIINPPDACILAVGCISPRLVMVDGEVKESNFMKVTLSCDHRVVDGASGSKFLQTLRDILEEPMRLII
ncbi:MAG: pyruvate dehydrogenase complex dihydrolipoamide acetyltransferase [Aureispira sp.]|nr:pyruvate dehydrogenase complex dihydrolipoamide acetyltransferase [Aureispira sp.]